MTKQAEGLHSLFVGIGKAYPLYTESIEREKKVESPPDRPGKMAKAGGALAREEKLWYNHTAKRGPAPGEERVGPYDPDQ